MSTPRFDLVDITKTLRDKRRLLLIVTLVAAIIGGVFYLVGKKRYKAQADFIAANPLYADRNNLFRMSDMAFIDYFGGDDDIDRILVIAESDTVRHMLARKLHLDEAYKLDLNKPEDRDKLKWIFKKYYKVERTEYKTGKVMFTDTDPERAAAVVNESVSMMEEMFRGYYLYMKGEVAKSIESKISEMDSSIMVLTDTLATLRDKYKIYDLMSPGRENLIVGGNKSGGGAGYGMAMETIQNIEATKDQLVEDRARNLSVLNEFLTGTTDTKDGLKYLNLVSPATAPVDPAGLGLILTVVACALLGFFFCSIYILLVTYYRLLINAER